MLVPVTIRTLSRYAALVLLPALLCPGQINSPWRFWDSTDGFREAYTSSTAPRTDGSLWVRHGDGRGVELMDGYSISPYPDPGGYGQIECTPDGTTLWMWSNKVLKRLSTGTAARATPSHWDNFKVDEVTSFGAVRSKNDSNWEITSSQVPYYRATISVVAVDRSHALIMLPDRVLEYDADLSATNVVQLLAQTGLSRFLSMRASRDGTVWLTGSSGAGRLSRNIHKENAIGAGPEHVWQWTAIPGPPSPWVDLSEPSEGTEGRLFVTGTAPSRAAAVLEFDGYLWKVIYRNQSGTLRAWAGENGTVWAQDGNRVIELEAGQQHVAEKTDALSGILLSVNRGYSEQFWVGSSQGLALHSPSLWKTPPGAPHFDDVVNAITEDHSGNVWFLSAQNLIRYDNTTWSAYPLPKGETAWAVFTDALAALPDGRLVILTTGSHWLIFDPAKGTFHVLQHPQNRILRVFQQVPDGTLIAETYPAGSSTGMTLESFDGKEFHPYLGTGYLPDDLRNIHVRPNGEIWVGSTSFFGVVRDAHVPGRAPIPATNLTAASTGYHDPGGYYIFDDPSGSLIVGGQDSLYFREGDKWRQIRSGLDRVRNIIRSRDGTLWVSSSTGIHRYRNGVWISNGLEEGLPSGVAYKVFEDSRGRIWAGTTRGLSLFNPSADVDPPVAILSEDQNPREAPPGGKIRLQFSGIDRWKMTPPDRLLFSYRIDAGPWSPFESAASASYGKLPAGPHLFEVRAMDRNGNISRSAASHAFSVLFPWYQARGFLGLAIGAVGVIVLLLTLAIRSYRHRGDLIRKLNSTNKLEHDRQSILELIARREPLPHILQRIADCLADNCPGSVCAVVLNHETIRGVFSQPTLPPAFLDSLHELTTATSGGSERWWHEIESISGQHFVVPCQVVPLPSVDAAPGIVVLVHAPVTNGKKRGDRRRGLPETFASIAAAAIENVGLYERLAHQARHDSLTGLPNRLSFDDRLRDAVSVAGAAGQTLSVLYIDLDRFKQINDSLGHRVGDLFLIQVAVRLSRALHETLNGQSVLARIGGDEFTVLLENGVSKALVDHVATAMLESLRSPVNIEGQNLFATASIGASFFPADASTPVALQKHADIAMYRAKARGKNCLEYFSAEMGSVTDAATSIEQILRKALGNGGFELHYQPQFTPAGGLVGFEALLRLREPGRVSLGPEDFIPIAEETGLIVPMGCWVLREACHQLRQWLDEGLPILCMAVNVSAIEIVGTSFSDEVAAVLAAERLDPGLLELELTESAIVRNPTESVAQMQKLRALGVRLAIDDFGTGYSSFANLQNLPVNTLKIDRSLLSGPAGAVRCAQLMRTIVDLGHSLGLTVVAEGVETVSHAAIVRESRCDVVQGFLFGRPQPASQARQLLISPPAETALQEVSLT